MIDLAYTIEFQGITYDATHGGPFDRGSADSYYGRPASPHKYPNGTGSIPRIEARDMSLAEMREYYKGYEYNEQFGLKKEWA
jgi:hypothetical protein